MLVHPAVDLDTMPNVVKEALAVGTPVVASDLAGIPEMLDGGRCGILVPPGDVGALARSIEGLLRDPGRCQAHAIAGREHVERHYDLWRNGRRLAERLRATVRARGK
jgi:glycosyltransferase involved in cell wall biosynthesis